MEESEATKTCPNCKREIPSRNFMTHSVHCTRNIKICTVCKEPVPQSELQDHHDKFHMLVPCKKCQEMVRGTDMEDHIRDSCAFTMQTCRFCSLELRRHDMPTHERYCGSRTERCGQCGEYVMLRYRQLHSDSNHTFICLDEDLPPKSNLGRPVRTYIQTTPARQESESLETTEERHQLSEMQRRIMATFPLFHPQVLGLTNPDDIRNLRDRIQLPPATLPPDSQPPRRNVRPAVRKRQAPAPPSQLSEWSIPSESVEASGTDETAGSVSIDRSRTEMPAGPVSTSSQTVKPASPVPTTSRTIKPAGSVPTASGTVALSTTSKTIKPADSVFTAFGNVKPVDTVSTASGTVALSTTTKTLKPVIPVSTTSGTVKPADSVPTASGTVALSTTSKTVKPINPVSTTSGAVKSADPVPAMSRAVKPVSSSITSRTVKPSGSTKPVMPDPKRDLPYYCAIRRRQLEEKQRAEQNARNLALGLPPVLDPAAKLEKLRKLDALQNPGEVDSKDYKNVLQGRVWWNSNISPGHRVGDSTASQNITNGTNGESTSPAANDSDEELLVVDRDSLRDVEPMTPEEFTARFNEMQLRRDRFGDIRSSLRDLRRGLNEVIAPYNNNNSSSNNNATVDSNKLNYRSELPNGSDQYEEARACSPLTSEVELPCEFCGEPHPAASLDLHQSECSASLERGSRPSSGRRRVKKRGTRQDSTESDEVPIIPCEFCTEALPYYLITEHQELCGREANLLY